MSDGWSDDEVEAAPEPLFTCRVVKDYIPTSNDELTLILDDLVYVFKESVPGKPGYWEGETLGIYGIFPKSYVKRQSKGDNATKLGKVE